MDQENAIKLFEDQQIRVVWDNESEKFYFSIVDVCQVLTDSVDGRKYWNKLKQRLKNEGNQLVTNCHQLKMKSSDGKYYKTDVADTEQLLRLIQSIPSPKAEPFKMWLAEVGRERIDEITDPEIAIDRALHIYLQKGYSPEWVNQRLKSIEVRKELTDEWNRSGVKQGKEYAILTNEITKAWAGMTVGEYKILKNLKNENLRDNMTNIELVLNMLAEASTSEISKQENPKGFEKSKNIARRGGKVAGAARQELENQTGKSAISSSNASTPQELETGNRG